ncbi:sensor histidine kinase [Aurantibacillus circumpalustris]|uniref:sensor histidine kinase n=1 Tax=Aurantibacillus circumpalustris TaxID=3036359 RepID=UPI00295AD25A|nr:HAMP domain-containing sensor histidine kinase [Aurantibacillus circumpalustris]
MKSGKVNFTSIILGLILIGGAIIFDRYSVFSIEEIGVKSTKAIEKKAELCKKAFPLLFTKDVGTDWEQLSEYYANERIGLYLWQNDSLIFWNNSQIPLPKVSAIFLKTFGFIKLPHGHYLYFKEVSGQKTALALCLVKPDYEIQNNYLKNDFKDWTGIPKGITVDTSSNAEHRITIDGNSLFSIKGGEEKFNNTTGDNLAFIFFLTTYLASLLLLLLNVKRSNNDVFAGFSVVGVLIIRFLMIGLKWPFFFYRTALYDLQLFGNAQSFMNGYLGDILLNAFTLLFIAAVFHFYSYRLTKQAKQFVYSALMVGFIFILFYQFNQIAVSLINNSTLSFDFLSIFNIKFEVFIGLGALSVCSLASFLLINCSLQVFNGRQFFVVYLCICTVHYTLYRDTGLFENYWLLLYAGLLFLLQKFYNSKIALALGLQILFMSVVTSKFLNTYIEKNQQQDLSILSIKLSDKQDAILENEFADIPRRMAQDEPLNRMLNFLADIPTAEKETELLLKQKYFGGYFNRYTVEFSLFDKNCSPLLEVKKPVHVNEGFFIDQIRENSDSTFVEGLFFVKNYKKNVQYIGKINLGDRRLYVMMEPKQFEELGSFPDLLLDQSQQKPEKLKSFSHAVYRSQQITSRFGDFNYPFSLQDSITLLKSNQDFIHHYYQPDENTEVIISQKAKRWNYFFTFNSYLLLFFSMVTYLSYLVYSAVFTDHFSSPTLTRRIQTIIIVLLLLAMSAVGITSGNLVSRQFDGNNKKQLEEKTQIIINELSSQFKAEQLFDVSQKELINLKLKEYSRLFNTPISLFYKTGQLFNTSESKLYENGLAASLVNPKAFWELNNNRSSSQSVTDKAGTLKYISLYTPLFDANKKLIGFINLPYFAKQSDLANELSGIISALINVYVILFVISILTGLILSGFITQPLRIIKQQLSNVTLGKQNEKIVWQSDDEIGKLVSEYNQMLVKLENSANLLAQSERESAWREMAKQVAHEIKNPLTPMKLNLQYLQMLMKSNPDDFKEKFERASAGIIEQIDSLANIANEFSNFAKLPGTQLQKINLVDVIASAMLIFENQKGVVFKNNISSEQIWVNGDRDQCLRVFNNVLKNALQALDGVKDPLINIDIEKNEGVVIIAISDNGCGIDDDMKSKIFTPNFTTKTTGSGLGLAMVKNIMLGFEGSISFTSESGKGTTFYLEFIPSEKGTL